MGMFLVLFTSTLTSPLLTKLTLNDSAVINGFGLPMGGGALGEPYNLLNEQTAAGDPAAGRGGVVKSVWMPGYTQWAYPETHAVIDLGGSFALDAVYGYRGYGTPNLTVSVGAESPFAPFAWSLTVNSSKQWPHDAWQGFNMSSIQARFVVITMLSPCSISELVIYGTRLGPPVPLPSPIAHPRKTFKQMAGVNIFADDPIERIAGLCGTAREYEEWSFTEGTSDPGYPHAQNAFSPSNLPDVSLDKFYTDLKAGDVDVHTVIQNRACFLYDKCANATEKQWAPLPDEILTRGTKLGDGSEINLTAIVDPTSYVALAAHAFQVAARYGVKHVDDALLQLAEGQPRLSGLGLVKHIEVMNEPNGWWKGERHGFMKPTQIAAMASAVYDGHCRTMPIGVGMKIADPTIEHVLASLTGTGRRNLDYMRMILMWARAYRKQQPGCKNAPLFPADALNFHGYGVSDDEQASDDKSPEELNMMKELATLIAWRDTYVPRMQIWDTEFGWDVDQRSPNRAPAYAMWSATDVQAMWHTRGFMAAAAAGMDRMQIYMLRDVQPTGTVKFLTCGLTSCKQLGWQPKRAWYTLATLTTLIGDMHYDATLTNAELDPKGGVVAMRFIVDASSSSSNAAPRTAGVATAAVIVWSPTKNGHEEKNVDVVLDASHPCPALLTLALLVMNSTNGEQSPLQPKASSSSSSFASSSCVVTLPMVNEMPLIVLLGQAPAMPTGPVPPITPKPAAICKGLDAGIYCNSSLPSWANLTAEDFVECPSAVITRCADGGVCAPTGNGTAQCAADPKAFCNGKSLGLYCDAAWPKPAKGWPDRFVECPNGAAELCPSGTPKCVQTSATNVKCGISGSE